ncbi:MAG: hypothetical protein RH916_05925 [Vicingaceae bacterium]
MRAIIIACISLGPCWVYAQVEELSPSEATVLENNAQRWDNESFNLEENQVYLTQHDINEITSDQLASLSIMTKDQCADLLAYRSQFGPILDLEELARIESFSNELIINLKQVLIVRSENQWHSRNQIDVKSSSDLRLGYKQVIEKKKGYINQDGNNHGHYPGHPAKLFYTFRHKYLNALEIGLRGEKDPGESFFRGAQKRGFDHNSGYLIVRGNKYLKELILGDFQLQVGRGLCFSTKTTRGKPLGIPGIIQKRVALSPNLSMSEYRYLRGFGARLEIGNFQILPFTSLRKLDAGIDQNNFITSIDQSGLHRSESEMAKRGKVKLTSLGYDLRYDKGNLTIGQRFVTNTYSHLFSKAKKMYQKFNSTSMKRNLAALDLQLQLRSLAIFGEFSWAINYGSAFIAGANFHLGEKIFGQVQFRNYSKSYHSPFTSSIAEKSVIGNELGLFSSLFLPINGKTSLNLSNDRFYFPFLGLNNSFPANGAEWALEMTHHLSKKNTFNIRLSSKYQQVNAQTTTNKLSERQHQNRESARIGITIQLNDEWRWRSRFEITRTQFDLERESGTMIFHEIKYKTKRGPISCLIRYTYFLTDSYQTRIYSYEQDIPGQFSIPANFGKGSRYFVVISSKINRHFASDLKFSQSFFEDQFFIGSSHESIEGSVKSDIALMLRYKL